MSRAIELQTEANETTLNFMKELEPTIRPQKVKMLFFYDENAKKQYEEIAYESLKEFKAEKLKRKYY